MTSPSGVFASPQRTAGWQSTISPSSPQTLVVEAVTFHLWGATLPRAHSYHFKQRATAPLRVCVDTGGSADVLTDRSSKQQVYHRSHFICACMIVIQGEELHIDILCCTKKQRGETSRPPLPPLHLLCLRKFFVILWVSLYIVAWHRSKVV